MYNSAGVCAMSKQVVLNLPESVAGALGVRESDLAIEVLRRIIASLYAQDRVTLEAALRLTGMNPADFAALVVSLRLSVGGSEAEERNRLWGEICEMGRIAKETGLTEEDIKEQVRAVRNARGR